jgi:hypothetical protein
MISRDPGWVDMFEEFASEIHSCIDLPEETSR